MQQTENRIGIAVAGNILTDEVKVIESFPEKGMLVNITAMSRAVGGSVPNTLISLAKIDPTLPLAALGRRGDDEAGRYAEGEVQTCGVATTGILVDPTAPTGFSATRVSAPSSTTEAPTRDSSPRISPSTP